MKNPSFSAFEWQNGLLYDYSANSFPTKLHTLTGEKVFHFEEGSTYFLFQHSGYAFIKGQFPLLKGYYASATSKEQFVQGSDEAKVLIIERIGFNGVFSLGGPIEHNGRLKYIDGCTDSLLVPPVKFGDPCLNHLHFPPGIDQTMHTHPSMRVGLVTRGHGECVTPFGNIPLFPGQLFIIHEDDGTKVPGIDGNDHPAGSHCFRTFDGTMDVIAYHPDSDFGPSDEEHPMINRTIVNGVSAKHIDEIKTQ
jgi:hypothetical protein